MFGTRSVVLRVAAAGVIGAVMTGVGGSASPAGASVAAAERCPSRSPATPPRGSLKNVGDVAIGVFHLADGNCTRDGAYDGILYPGWDTFHHLHWNEVAGAYIGAGYWAKTLLPGEDPGEFYCGETHVLDPYYTAGDWQIVANPGRPDNC
jgi:hypothetical protein